MSRAPRRLFWALLLVCVALAGVPLWESLRPDGRDPRRTVGAELHVADGYLRWTDQTKSAGWLPANLDPIHMDDKAVDETTSGGLRLRLTTAAGKPAARCRIVVERSLRPERMTDVYVSDPRRFASDADGTARLSLARGCYRVFVLGPDGGAWTRSIRIRAGLDNGEIVGQLSPTDAVRVEVIGDGASAAQAILVAGPHPCLSIRRPLAAPTVPLPRDRETRVVALDESGGICGVARAFPGTARVSVACPERDAPTATPRAAEPLVYCESTAVGTRAWFRAGPFRSVARPSGAFLLRHRAGAAPSLVGEPPLARPRLLQGRIEGPAGRQPWKNAEILVVRRLQVGSRKVSVTAAVGRTDAAGAGRVRWPMRGPVSVTLRSPGYETRTVHEDGLIAGSRAASDDSWRLRASHGEVTCVVEGGVKVTRAADALGFVEPPVRPKRSAILVDWAGRAHSDPRSIEYIATRAGLRPWTLHEATPKSGTARLCFADGKSRVPSTATLLHAGARGLGRRARAPDTEGHVVVPAVRRTGTYCLITQEAEPRVVAIRPFVLQARAASLCVRYGRPRSGISLRDVPRDAEVWLFRPQKGGHELLWRSSTSREADVLLLPKGRYFVHVQSKQDLLVHREFELAAGIVNVSAQPMPARRFTLRVAIRPGVFVSRALISVRSKRTGRRLALLTDRTGIIDVALPDGEYGLRRLEPGDPGVELDLDTRTSAGAIVLALTTGAE